MATMTRDEISQKVRDVLVDALGVDEDEVQPEASLKQDLGAESIDYLDITFRLEKAFANEYGRRLDIPRGELFSEDWDAFQADPKFVQKGLVTSEGLAEIQRFAPQADLYEFRKNPLAAEAEEMIITVVYLVNYIERRLNEQPPRYKAER
jgi:acyl carrier protein